MRKFALWLWIGVMPLRGGEMPGKAANYHAALTKRPESAALFERFRNAWLEERTSEELETELRARAEAGDPGAWAILARALRAAGGEEAAMVAFGKAREQAPAAWLDLETARLRLAARDFATAETDALRVPADDPLRADALKLAGLACLRGGRVDEALAHWQAAVAAAPGDKGLLEDLTEMTRREGRFDLALEFCETWRAATDDAYGKAMAGLSRSELLMASQRFDEAMEELAAVLKVSADGAWLEREAIARAEQAHRQRGNATGWAAWIGARAEENPTRMNFRRAHAHALAATGKSDEALLVLAEVMKRSPGETAARWQRVDLLERALKLDQAYAECADLAKEEKSEAAGLRLAELAFRLEKRDAVKQALDGVMAAADPAKHVSLAGLYARYGLPEVSERAWRAAAAGEHAGQALRELAKHLRAAGRESEAIAVLKQLGARDIAGDRIEAANLLAAAGERGAARGILQGGRETFRAQPGYEAAVAELALLDGKPDEAVGIYLSLARAARRPDELSPALKGWLRSVAKAEDPLKDLGGETPDRCLRAACLAEAGKPLPELLEGDALERTMRMTLLREYGKWADVVAMMEASADERGPVFLSELAAAKSAAGDLPGALAAARTWRERVPELTAPWLSEASALEKSGKFQEATALLRRAAARFEDDEEVARQLFSVLQKSADVREALAWAWQRHDRAADESNRSGWLREILRVSKERSQLGDLQERFEERARRDPASPGPLLALAELAKARGDSRAELDFLRRAAVNAPQDVPVVSALAAVEERAGETERALERHAMLARLVPGPDSARQFAQAKIRLGDIEGGVRDLQALAGESGIDLRALEQSAGDLAARGHVEEAARLLAAVDPARRDARLYYVLGLLLEADGREARAIDAYVKVMAEPDDPAEAALRAAYGLSHENTGPRYSLMVQGDGGRRRLAPGVFSGLEIPQSLVEAKMQVKLRLAGLARQHGGEVWSKAAAIVPELAFATPEQWREATEFARSLSANWWLFLEKHPDNPLGIELLAETGQTSSGTPEQVRELLDRDPRPSLRLRMVLRSGNTWQPDNTEFLEALDDEAWRDDSVRRMALRMVERMFLLAIADDAAVPVTAAEFARGVAVLENLSLKQAEASRLAWLRMSLALLENQPEEFLRRINAMEMADDDPHRYPAYTASNPFWSAFVQWRKTAGEKAADTLVARIESPVWRCTFNLDQKPEQRLAQVARELAALPDDAPLETRRNLIRLKWSLRTRGETMDVAFRKELQETAADDSDPRLAAEATMWLTYNDGGQHDLAQRPRFLALLRRLETSPDEGDRAYAARFAAFSGGSQTQNPPVATRWGGRAQFSNSYAGHGVNSNRIKAVIALEDRTQAEREAARLLENAARASGGNPQYLREPVKTLSDAGLLDGALARISLPADAGLSRKLAMVALMDACGQPEHARQLLAEIAASRPWETRWNLDLALRAADDAEAFRLLDGVADRGDFDDQLSSLLLSANHEKADPTIARLSRLAAWAKQGTGPRGWIGPVLIALADGGRGGLQKLDYTNAAQVVCYQRYLGLALATRECAELGFRVFHATYPPGTPEVVTGKARQALLSGNSTSRERSLLPASSQGMSNLPQAPSALEHLVITANEAGDEVAFPPEFRERLKTVDPQSAAWIDKLLAAKTVADLPDVSIDQTRSADWVALARHEAAVLRAMNLPGRDAWLTAVFRDKKLQLVSQNIRHVIRRSLLDAKRKNAMPQRVIGWLESGSGPRGTWKPETPACAYLPQQASFVLESLAETDAAILLEVLDVFRDAQVPANDATSPFMRLANLWRKEGPPPQNRSLSSMLDGKPMTALKLGVWQWSRDSDGTSSRFVWGLPHVLRQLPSDGRGELAKAVKEKPDAVLLELLQAWSGSHDKALQRRILLKATPDLTRLPAGVRHGVIDALTQGMDGKDRMGLPDLAAARLDQRLDAERQRRLELARRKFEELKAAAPGLANQSQQVGSLLGPVLADDEAFVSEVLAVWRPLAEADQSGREIETFAGALLYNTRRDPEITLGILRLLDSLWKGTPPLPPRSAGYNDPLHGLWIMEASAMNDPQVWSQTAALSPKMRAKIWLNSSMNTQSDFGMDPALVKSLRAAAAGSEVTRSALEWQLQNAASRRDSASKVDGAALLAFLKALKDAGSSVEGIAVPLCRAYHLLYRMDDPAAVMAETPLLLDGLKAFPENEGNRVFESVQRLHEQFLRDHRKATGNHSATSLPAAMHPVETAALLKFAFTREPGRTRPYLNHSNMTSIVLSTGDAELLDLWTGFAGDSLTGDLTLILHLLENDRIADAVALAPAPDKRLSTSQPFTATMEALTAKLSANPTPQAFRLRLKLSMFHDARGDEAPAEKLADRETRLAAEFERRRGDLLPAERADHCLALRLADTAFFQHVPALDEFADGNAASEFRKTLFDGNDSATVAGLFVPAACSRVYDGDFTGIARLTGIIAAAPAGRRKDTILQQITRLPLLACLVDHADLHDAKLPEASAETITAFAGALAACNSMEVRGFASYLVHLAAADHASLDAGLKRFGLDGVKPTMTGFSSRRMTSIKSLRSAVRVALLHPVASQELLPPEQWHQNLDSMSAAIRPLLHDQALRAKLPPTLFLFWNRQARNLEPQDLEPMKLYAAERRSELNERQTAELDFLLNRLETLSSSGHQPEPQLRRAPYNSRPRTDRR